MTARPLILLLAAPLLAQDAAMAPAVLPGNGLAQHDFFYAGEQKQQQMFIVKKGKVAWSYLVADSKGEISDAVMLSNGNILFAHQFGVTLITPDKKVVWNYDCPAGTEVHTAQPIGTKHVVFIQNGDPAILRVVNIATNQPVREFPLPTGNPKSVHGHFRHARLTAAGTILVAHMDNKKVAEYDSNGKEVWSYAIESPWSASRLANGNTLIVTNKKLVVEVDPKGQTVWPLGSTSTTSFLLVTISVLPLARRLADHGLSMAYDQTSLPLESYSATFLLSMWATRMVPAAVRRAWRKWPWTLLGLPVGSGNSRTVWLVAMLTTRRIAGSPF